MRWLVIGPAIVVGWLLLGTLGAQQKPVLVPEAEQERVMEVFSRHAKEIEENQDVLGLIPSPGTGEIWIITDRPVGMPTNIEGVPVVIKPPPPHLPPPPGVIILKPEGVQEHLPQTNTCPPGHVEMRRYRWRFCNPQEALQPIPAPMAPPIAGIPYKEAEEIYKRNVDRLMELPGVNRVGLGADGITVNTDHPELVPPSVEGLPVKTAPRVRIRHTNHTYSTRTDPFHGGIAISDLVLASPPEGVGTAAGIVLSEGKPWLVTVAHGLELCDQPPPCPPGSTLLNACPHYYSPGQFFQSPSASPGLIARMARWPRFQNGSTVDDVAAGFVDNDSIEGNGSAAVDRQLHGSPTEFSGIETVGIVSDFIYN